MWCTVRTIANIRYCKIIIIIVVTAALLYSSFITMILIIVQSLISHGALVNEQDNIGNTPLHLGKWIHVPIIMEVWSLKLLILYSLCWRTCRCGYNIIKSRSVLYCGQYCILFQYWIVSIVYCVITIELWFITLIIIGTNLMMTDTRGSTPLHLALSRLRMLDTRSALRQTTPNNHRKREVEKVKDCMYIYYNQSDCKNYVTWSMHIIIK